MHIVAVIQARTGSSRLPGKVLKPLSGKPLLAQVIARVRRSTLITDIVVATTVHPNDDPVVQVAEAAGARVFRGSEQDVLSRYVGAATMAAADIVVRITSDCPLVDASILDRAVSVLLERRNEVDYASNVLNRTYPEGLDVEAFFFDVLLRIDRMAVRTFDREHVTTFLRGEGQQRFLLHSIEDTENNSHLRLTVDRLEDYEKIAQFYDRLQIADTAPSYREMLAGLQANPDLINYQPEGLRWTWDPTKVTP